MPLDGFHYKSVFTCSDFNDNECVHTLRFPVLATLVIEMAASLKGVWNYADGTECLTADVYTYPLVMRYHYDRVLYVDMSMRVVTDITRRWQQ